MAKIGQSSQGNIVSAFLNKDIGLERNETLSNEALSNQEAVPVASRSIGAILIDAGRLTPAHAESILRKQRERGLQFGDAALELGLLSPADIEYALSHQFNYPYLRAGEGLFSEELIAAYHPFSPQVETLRALRSQLVLRWFDGQTSHKLLAITSPAQGEGRSFIAANLAIVFSQLGERTLLIDANLRRPRQHHLFGLDNRVGLSAILSGREGMGAIQRIPSFVDLSVLPSGAMPPNPHELLSRSNFTNLLNQLSTEFDIVLIDTPAAVEYPDASMVANRAGATLVVARNNISHVGALRQLAESFNQANAIIVGTVLNEF